MTNPDFHGLSVGDQLGNLEYVVDDTLARVYRDLAGDSASYPNLIADDCQALLLAKCGPLDVNAVWNRFEFLRPPVLGRRVQAGGWLRGIHQDDGGLWLRISTFAVDEIGTEILRSEAVFAVGARPAEQLVVVSNHQPPRTHGFGRLAEYPAGGVAVLGQWTLPDCEPDAGYAALCRDMTGRQYRAESGGTSQLLAARLEGLLTSQFGDDFSWGGGLSLAFQAPALPGENITATAVVIGSDRDHAGVLDTRLIIGLSNGQSQQIALGEATIQIPSRRLF